MSKSCGKIDSLSRNAVHVRAILYISPDTAYDDDDAAAHRPFTALLYPFARERDK